MRGSHRYAISEPEGAYSTRDIGYMNTWDRFNSEARNILYVADQEARRMQGNWISTEHLLIGILSAYSSKAVQLLEELGFSTKELILAIQRQRTRMGNLPYDHIQFTPNAIKAIELSSNEAE